MEVYKGLKDDFFNKMTGTVYTNQVKDRKLITNNTHTHMYYV